MTGIILGFRFLYGIRSVTPFVIGLSKISPVRFLFLNAVGALIWAIAAGLLGYSLGQVLDTCLDKMKRYEMTVMTVILALISKPFSPKILAGKVREPLDGPKSQSPSARSAEIGS